jgi:TRAP transporter TAXI family solute receptor
MRPVRLGTAGLVGLVVCALAAGGCAGSPPVKPTSIASGAVGGIYQPIAEAIAKIARESPGLGLPLTVESTGASVANAQLLGDGRVQLALIQNDIAFYAAQGITLAAFRGKAREDLRAIMSLYPEYVHIVAAPNARISSVTDLRGKRVAIGPEGSGTEQNALQVLEASGVKSAELGWAERIDTAQSVTRMRAGQLDAAFFTVGAGSPLVTELLGQGARLVAVTPAQITQLRSRLPYYWTDQIPAGTYPGQTAAVSTPSLRVLLATRENAEESAVYGLTKALVDNLAALRAAHPAASGLDRSNLLRVLTLPLHPGALRLYKERNIQQ